MAKKSTADAYHLVWSPRKSRDPMEPPGRTHIVCTDSDSQSRLGCGKQLNNNYLRSSECRKYNVKIPRSPSAKVWPTCTGCANYWIRVLESLNIRVQLKKFGWEIAWEERAGIREPGASARWEQLQSETHEMLRGSSLLWETPLKAEDPVEDVTTSERRTLWDMEEFSPRSSTDYTVRIPESEQIRHRWHEKLIADYGTWISTRDYTASVNYHPIDLVLRQPDREILVEAKINDDFDDTRPAREAIGQLFEYRHKYRRGRDVHLALLLSHQLNAQYIEFLESLRIACVWRDNKQWGGSPSADALSMTTVVQGKW